MALKDQAAAMVFGVLVGAGGASVVRSDDAPRLVPFDPAAIRAVDPPAAYVNCTGTEKYKVGRPCDGPDEDEYRCGTWRCPVDAPGAAVCDEPEGAQPYVEVCDGKDNDCDGRIDNSFRVGAPCALEGGRDGTVACAPDGTAVCASSTP